MQAFEIKLAEPKTNTETGEAVYTGIYFRTC